MPKDLSLNLEQTFSSLKNWLNDKEMVFKDMQFKCRQVPFKLNL